MWVFALSRVLFPGGGVSIQDSGYAEAAQHLYKLAIQVMYTLAYSCGNTATLCPVTIEITR